MYTRLLSEWYCVLSFKFHDYIFHFLNIMLTIFLFCSCSIRNNYFVPDRGRASSTTTSATLTNGLWCQWYVSRMLLNYLFLIAPAWWSILRAENIEEHSLALGITNSVYICSVYICYRAVFYRKLNLQYLVILDIEAILFCLSKWKANFHNVGSSSNGFAMN